MATNIKNISNSQKIVQGLIFTMATVLIWVGFSLFQSQQRTGIAPELLRLAEPLNPNIDTEALGRIEEKRVYSEAELSNFTVYRLVRDRSGFERVVTDISGLNEIRGLNDSAASSAAATPELDLSPVELPTSPTSTSSAEAAAEASNSSSPNTPLP